MVHLFFPHRCSRKGHVFFRFRIFEVSVGQAGVKAGACHLRLEGEGGVLLQGPGDLEDSRSQMKQEILIQSQAIIHLRDKRVVMTCISDTLIVPGSGVSHILIVLCTGGKMKNGRQAYLV